MTRIAQHDMANIFSEIFVKAHEQKPWERVYLHESITLNTYKDYDLKHVGNIKGENLEM